MELLRHVRISVELDTTKATYSEEAGNVEEFVAWWNEHAPDFGLPVLSLADSDGIPPEGP